MTERTGSWGAYAAVFARIEVPGRAELVTRRLAEAITLGVLPDGLPLPPEPELADRLGVATVTLREALRALRDDGLIRTRRGRGGGSFVRTPGDRGLGALRRRVARLATGEVRDLGDHYAAVSGSSAALAAVRADPDEIRALRAAATPVAEARTPTEVLRAEARFHLDLAAASQSARLTRVELEMHREVGHLLWLTHVHGGDAHQAGHRHTAIVDAIEAGDPAAARSSVEAHVDDLVRELVRHHHDIREEQP